MKTLLCIFCLLFGGCGIYNDSFKPEVLAEKKIFSSRKSQITQNGKTMMIAIATYLNNVNPSIFNDNREYFLLEIFSELEIPLIDYMNFNITDNAKLLWIREVDKDEFDSYINVSNKWSKAFLVAFEPIDEHYKKNMKLILDVDTIGSMSFDFSYKVFEMKF